MSLEYVFDLLNQAERDMKDADPLGYSAELGIAVQSDEVLSSDDLMVWCKEVLTASVEQRDLPSTAASWRWVDQWLAGAEADSIVSPSSPYVLEEINTRYAGSRSPKKGREVSARAGRSMIRQAEIFLPGGTLPPMVSAWVELSVDPNVVQFPIAWGLICRATGIALQECLSGMIEVVTRSVCEGAARLIGIGPREVIGVQRLMLDGGYWKHSLLSG